MRKAIVFIISMAMLVGDLYLVVADFYWATAHLSKIVWGCCSRWLGRVFTVGGRSRANAWHKGRLDHTWIERTSTSLS